MCKHCDDADHAPKPDVSRRQVLRYGAGAMAAASFLAHPWARAFAEEGNAAEGGDQVDLGIANRGKAKQVVFLFMSGGASHIDTFDPKPGATTNGPTRAIDTSVTGVKIASSLPENRQAHEGHRAHPRHVEQGGQPRARPLPHAHRLPADAHGHARGAGLRSSRTRWVRRTRSCPSTSPSTARAHGRATSACSTPPSPSRCRRPQAARTSAAGAGRRPAASARSCRTSSSRAA